MRVRRRLLSPLLVSVAIFAVAAPAQGQVREFVIPGGSLKDALDALARQSGLQVIYQIDDVRNLRSPGVRSRRTADAALKVLLEGSGLEARSDPSGAIAIVRLNVASNKAEIPDLPETRPNPVIVVTGSRIVRPIRETAAPAVSISSRQLFQTGNTTTGEALNELPQFRSTLTQSNSTRIDTGAGLNMLDLRGLGINRTLVLENGRRHIPGAPFTSAVDVNAIPMDLIERVDIVAGGSSAIYGSDAIAGVVNFVLKRDFEGVKLRGQQGVSGHGDADQALLSALVGANFSDGRGNLTAHAEFAHSDDWYASDRSSYRRMATYTIVDTDPLGVPNGSDGSPDSVLVRDRRSFGVSNGGTFFPFPSGRDSNVLGYLFQPDGTLALQTGTRVGLPPFATYEGGNGSNLREGKQFSVSPDLKRYNFNLQARFTISPAFEPFVEAKYARVNSFGSSFGSFFTVGDWGPRDGYRTDNPYLSDQARQFIRSSLGIANGEEEQFPFRRSFAELGPFVQHNRRDTYRIVGGLRGNFGSGWSYDVSANLARVTSRTRFTGNVNVQRYLLSIDAVRDPATGQIVCRSRINPSAAAYYENAVDVAYAAAQLARDVAECVPINPFGAGNISPAARDYLLTDTGSRSRITQTVLNGFVTGDSSGWLELPGGPVGIAAGAEYRRETFRDVQDELLSSGITHGTPLPPFAPSAFSVKEAFAELRLPLLRHRPFFEALTASAAGRLADYGGTIGKVFAWNTGLEWAPIDGLRFRINRSRAIRAPNLVELDQPIGQNFSTVPIRDPCSLEYSGAGSPSREANCHADGVPDGFRFAYSTSFPYLAGGNPDLHQEKSDSLTLGVILEPRIVPGLSFSADYYDIKVKDVITAPTVQSILDACYDAATIDNPFCRLFARHSGPGSGPDDERPGQILRNSLHVVPLNYAALRVRGIDFEGAYHRRIPGLGELDSRFLYTLALQNDSFLTPDAPGRKDQNLIELGNPRHALQCYIGLKRGIVTVGYQLRYFSKMSVGAIENIRSVQGRPPQNDDAFSSDYFKGAAIHGVDLQFEVGKRSNFYVGVRNVANRLPPASLTGVSDEGGIYDNVGRFFYAGAVERF